MPYDIFWINLYYMDAMKSKIFKHEIWPWKFEAILCRAQVPSSTLFRRREAIGSRSPQPDTSDLHPYIHPSIRKFGDVEDFGDLTQDVEKAITLPWLRRRIASCWSIVRHLQQFCVWVSCWACRNSPMWFENSRFWIRGEVFEGFNE